MEKILLEDQSNNGQNFVTEFQIKDFILKI